MAHISSQKKRSVDPRSTQAQRRRRSYRRSAWDVQATLLGLACLVAIGVLIFFFFHLFAIPADSGGTANAGGNNTSSNSSVPTENASASTCGLNQQGQQQGQCSDWWSNPDFQNTVGPQLFKALNLTKDQVVARIQAGSSLTAIAQQQGIAQDQWYQIEYTAAKAGFDLLVSKNELPVIPLASDPGAKTPQDMENFQLKDVKTKGMDWQLEQMLGISVFDLPGGPFGN